MCFELKCFWKWWFFPNWCCSTRYKKEDIKINIENDIIKISAESESKIENENEKCTKREYSYKSFSRSFTIPESADIEKIDAKSLDGILKVIIKKKDEEIVKAPREIKIK